VKQGSCARCQRTRDIKARGLCTSYYNGVAQAGSLALWTALNPECDGWINPLVCGCDEPDADPRIAWGMCQTCKRKPLALFKASS